VTTTPNTLSTEGAVTEKIVAVEMTVALYQKNGKLVKTFGLSDYEYYSVQTLSSEEYARREAIRRMSARMARRFSSQLLLEY